MAQPRIDRNRPAPPLPHYEDFVVQLEALPTAGLFRARVLASPAGQGSAVVQLPVVASENKDHFSAAGRGVARLDAGRPAPTQQGEVLYRSLFQGQVRNLLERSLGVLESQNRRGLRIKLKLDTEPDSAAIHRLPWELLFAADTRDFLALSRRTSIVRQIDVPRAPKPIELARGLRVLAVAANPSNLPPLDLAAEVERMGRAMVGSGVQLDLAARPSLAQIRQQLQGHGHHVLHFMGHGSQDPVSGHGLLHLESERGEPEQIRGDALAAKLKDLDQLGLVVLNACHSASAGDHEDGVLAGLAGELVRGGLRAVVAMQRTIEDSNAILFSEAFYRQLAKGEPLDVAMTEGRQAIHSADPTSSEWAVPALFLQLADGALFIRPESAGNRSRRWLTLAASGLVLLPTSMAIPELRQALLGALAGVSATSAAAESFVLELDTALPSGSTLLSGRLVRLELLPSKRMRLSFALPEGDQDGVPVDPARTYIADETGSRYEVVGAGKAARGRSGEGPTPATHWLEFPAPRDGARSFKIGLAPLDREQRLPMVDLKLPAYPQELSLTTPSTAPPPGAQRLDIEVPRLESSVPGLDGAVAEVVVLPSQRMRWQIDVFNRSSADQQLGIDPSRLLVVDDQGNRYPVLASSAWDAAAERSKVYRTAVEQAVRTRYWFDLPAPFAAARRFRVELGRAIVEGPRFRSASFATPQISPKLSRPNPLPATPQGGLRLTLDRDFGSNQPKLEGRLRFVDLLPTGGMVWHLSFWNRSESTIDLGLAYPRIEILDGRGERYAVMEASTGLSPTQAFREPLEPGVRSDHWLRLPAPVGSAARFRASLVGHNAKLRFSPFEIGPLSYPDRFARAPTAVEAPAAEPGPPVPILPTEPAAPEPPRVEPPKPSRAIAQSLLPKAAEGATNRTGLDYVVTEVFRLENGGLRLELGVRNRSEAAFAFALLPAATYLGDDRGTVYSPIRSSFGEGAQAGLPGLLEVPSGTEATFWLEFGTLHSKARELSLVLAVQPGSGVHFRPLRFNLP